MLSFLALAAVVPPSAACVDTSPIPVNDCLVARLKESEVILDRYFQTAKKHIDKETVGEFTQAQRSWLKYREAECGAVFDQYEFPGNIRELRNALERALLMSPSQEITPDALPPSWLMSRPSQTKMPSLEEIERNYISEVLRQTRGKKVKAAKILGISRKTLLEKRKKYGLQ